MINWHAWSAQAFNEARRTNRLVLLDLTAVWCHWCHVMDATTYADPQVARLLQSEFIPVRVESDKRPDINERYNQGGWPSTVFLTPDGEVLSGATYLSPADFVRAANGVLAAWRADRTQLEERLSQLKKQLQTETRRGRYRPGTLTFAYVEEALGVLKNRFDKLYGGFGLEPKFPEGAALRLLIEAYAEKKNETLEKMIRLTLTNMIDGLFDDEEGGFYRYSTTRNWNEPHYEKLLAINAELMEVYALAGAVLGEGRYRLIAERTWHYLETVLRSRTHAVFFGSQDAGIDESYWHRALAGRREMKTPAIDETIYVDQNALAAQKMFNVGALWGDAAMILRARGALDFLLAQVGEPARDVPHVVGKDEPRGLLTDVINLLGALIWGYMVTADRRYFTQAIKYASSIAVYRDNNKDGFFDCLRRGEAPGALRDPVKSVADNVAVAETFTMLWRLTDDLRHEKVAASALHYLAGDARLQGVHQAQFGLAALHYLTYPHHVVVIGKHGDRRSREFLAKAFAEVAPWKIVHPLDPEEDVAVILLKGYTVDTLPVVYRCTKEGCGRETS